LQSLDGLAIVYEIGLTGLQTKPLPGFIRVLRLPVKHPGSGVFLELP